MSPPAGSFGGFFPSAPSVLQERQKKARLKESSQADVVGDAANNRSTHIKASPSPRRDVEKRSLRANSRDNQTSMADVDDTGTMTNTPGDLLNVIGSASSLASTVSSVFSNGIVGASTHLDSHTNGMPLTPMTSHESSPPHSTLAPGNCKVERYSGNEKTHLSRNSPRQTAQRASTATVEDTVSNPRQARVQARPGIGQVKGTKLTYDPELDQKLASKDKRKFKPRYKKFGEEQEQPPPPDPRLAIPGYQSGTVDIKLGGDAKTWKQRLRTAPYAVPPYAWDPATSAGSGPTTSVAVFGFDPFTPESQIRALFASYGHIAELDNKTDLNTGTFLGVCSIRYKDSRPTRGQPVLAVDAAKRAESEGNGQRLGMNTIRVEKDRGGRRGKRIVESMTRRNEQRREKEKRTMTAPPSATVAMSSPSGLGPAPPPNAPKGPSGKPAGKPPEAPRAMLPQKSHAPSLLIETEPVLSRIKRMPYCFISHVSVPVLGTTIPHLKRRMKNYDWHEIAVDLSGYFIIFEDSKRGEDEALKCFQGTNNQAMFTYNMVVECQQYGNPNYERSPSPERALAEKREKDESERVRRNDEQDIEEEKKQRALNLDPVLAALEQVRVELRDKIMTDVKTRIAAPALYDFLDPTRHTAKRRKLNIADPTEHSRQPTFLNFIDEKDSNSVSGTLKKPLPFSSSISRLRKEFSRPSGNAFMDERRQRPVKRRTEVRSLHQRLPDYYAEDESEDEHSGPQTYDTESRQLSRHSSVTAGFDQDDYVYKGQHPLGRDETPLDAESGDDGIVTAKSLLEPGLLKKEPEDMAVEELQLLINSLPLTHRLHKRAKIEMLIRRKTRDDDQLFHIKTEDIEETQLVEDAGVIPAETISDMLVESAEFVLESKASKKSKAKKKSKKQIFEEREAAKAEEVSLETLLAATDAEEPTQDVPMLNDVEAETAEEQEMEERAEVEWGVSMEAPRRTVEDDPGIVLDVDGWQHLIKDDEDLQFLKEALEDQSAADLGDVDSWVSRQKNIKALNNGGNYGIVKVAPQIQGYYNPHISGCARTEGMKKIVESEKSKYLPHRIKVAQARARREAAAESDPVIDAEAVRQAKLVSNATSRSTRANNRTHIKDINTVKQVLALGIDGAQSDAIRFNQLKKRKKLVKFDRSAIHGWGLYAEENIALGDMIIEYVGEKVRQAVANIRELRYDKQGMGSSYLFRIDEDSVVDATKKGGIARFINHSCAPNCTAKIIRVDGTKRIVIYALREIAKNDELTYDYKFDREMNDDDRIPCLCGSEVCKGFLN